MDIKDNLFWVLINLIIGSIVVVLILETTSCTEKSNQLALECIKVKDPLLCKEVFKR